MTLSEPLPMLKMWLSGKLRQKLLHASSSISIMLTKLVGRWLHESMVSCTMQTCLFISTNL